MKNSDHLKVYLGSKKSKYALPQGFLFASHGGKSDFELMRFSDLDAIQPEWAGEYYWLFSLKRTLCSMGNLPKQITVAFEERFVFNEPLGHPFRNNPHYHVVTEMETEGVQSDRLIFSRAGEAWLLGQPLFFGGDMTLLENYHRCHHLYDLLHFSTTAMKFNLPEEYLFNFLSAKFIFPYSSVGTFEVEPFFKILDVLENVAVGYSRNGWIRRDGYQGKNMRFLLERLHSFLLTVHLEQQGVLNKPEIYGFHTIRSDSEVYSDQ